MVEIKAWANPSLPDDPILQVTLPDTSSKSPVVSINAGGIKVVREVNEEVQEVNEIRWKEWRLGPGWVDLRLTITENITLSTTGQHGRPLVSRALPSHLHSLHLTASNLTADCLTGAVYSGNGTS